MQLSLHYKSNFCLGKQKDVLSMKSEISLYLAKVSKQHT